MDLDSTTVAYILMCMYIIIDYGTYLSWRSHGLRFMFNYSSITVDSMIVGFIMNSSCTSYQETCCNNRASPATTLTLISTLAISPGLDCMIGPPTWTT